MRNVLVLVALACALLPCGSSDAANGVFVPPNTDPADNANGGLSSSEIETYLGHVETSHVFREFEGQSNALKASSPEGPVEQIGVGCIVDLASGSLFPASFQDGAYTIFETAVSSVSASALRLHVDLSALGSGETLWVIDPLEKQAFGPFDRGDTGEDGIWLPTVGGDKAILVVRSSSGSVPAVRLVELSHIYSDIDGSKAAVLTCHNNIACETDTYIQELSSGVGLALVTHTGGTSYLGSGALINVPGTDELEPYFLTANHLISTESDATNAEVFWDFRSTSCSSSNAGSYTACPRSDGTDLLKTDQTLDATLIELDSVPISTYGRAYLGWDTRDPVIDEDVIVMHHPAGSHMRITYGRVQSIDQTVSARALDGQTYTYEHETRVGWDDGVTQGGSSGSCLLFADGTYRITGSLTTGSNHVCTNPSPAVNYDYFSSFRDFMDDLSPDILSGASCDSVYDEAGQVEVPNVVGMTQTAAATALTSAGLVAGAVTQEYSDTVASGVVISQDPAAGESVIEGTAVALAVSKGPEPSGGGCGAGISEATRGGISSGNGGDITLLCAALALMILAGARNRRAVQP